MTNNTNTMTKAENAANSNLVKFKADNGELVQFTRDDVKKLICPQASDKDVALFLATCQRKRLDPIGSKDAYLVGYNSKDGFRATMITSYHVFNRRASANPDYDGIESGVVVLNEKTGQIYDKIGASFYPEAGEKLVGAYARVFLKSKSHPVEERVRFSEFNTNKSNWLSMPGTMIEKVAKSKAWRTAFPEEFSGLYEASEMDQATQGKEKPVEVIDVTPEASQTAVEAEKVETPANTQAEAPQSLTDAQKAYLQDKAEQIAQLEGSSVENAKRKIILTCGNPTTAKDWADYERLVEELLASLRRSRIVARDVTHEEIVF